MGAKITQNPNSSYFKGVKVYLALVFVCLTCLGYAQPGNVSIRPLQDYHFFSENELKDGVNCFVLTNRKQMEKMFGKIDRPDTPDFAKEFLLVMVMPVTKKETRLGYKGISVKAGEFIEVYCDVSLKGHRLTYDYNPIAVAIIPRYNNVRTIHFFDEKKKRLISSVAVSERL